VKLGRSTRPSDRLVELQCGAAGLGELVALVPEHVMSEREAHAKWQHLRVTGEWFEYTDELEAWLAGLLARVEAERDARPSQLDLPL